MLYDLIDPESTQIGAPGLDMEKQEKAMREIAKAHDMEEKIQINVAELQKLSNEFRINAKNKTLFQVLIDNRKSIERRIMPLLDMFKVENTYFS